MAQTVDCSTSDLAVSLVSNSVGDTPGVSICPCTNSAADGITLTAMASGGNAAYTYAWSTGSGNDNQFETVCPISTTTYMVTVSDNDGCTATATLTINVDDQISNASMALIETTGNINNDGKICSGSSFNLSVPNVPGWNYFWAATASPAGYTFSGTNDSYQIGDMLNTTGNYTFCIDIDNDSGCTVRLCENIEVFDVPVADAGAIATGCASDVFTLNGSASTGTSLSYYWTASAGSFDDPTLVSPDYTNTNAGTSAVITLTVKDSNGCIDDDNLIVTILPNPTIDLEVSPDPACYDGVNPVNVTITDIDNMGTMYEWYSDSLMTSILTTTTNSASFTFTPDDNGFYYVEVTDVNGCVAVDSIEVEIFESPSVPDETFAMCDDCSIVISCGVVNGSASAMTHAWTYNTTSTILISDFTQVNPDQCSTIITVDDGLMGTIVLDYTVTDTNGCTATGTKTINVNNGLNAVKNITACEGDRITLDADTNGICGDLIYMWTDDAGNIDQFSLNDMASSFTVDVTSDGTVSVEVSQLDPADPDGMAVLCSITTDYVFDVLPAFSKEIIVCNAGDDTAYATYPADPNNITATDSTAGTWVNFMDCVNTLGLPTDGTWSENGTSNISLGAIDSLNNGLQNYVDFWGIDADNNSNTRDTINFVYTYEMNGATCASDLTVYVASCFDLALDKVVCDIERGGSAIPFVAGTAYLPNDIVTYAITIYNQGAVMANNIVVNDYMPTAMNFIDGDGTAAACGGGITPWAPDSATSPIPFTNNFMTTGTINLAGGTSTTIYVRGQIDMNASAAFILNNAEITEFEDDSGMMPADEDDLFGSGATNGDEVDDETGDDFGGGMDDPNDDDQFDFASVNVMCMDDPFACNDHIQVSLDVDCRALITPDMILEDDMGPNCGYNIELINDNTGEVLPSSPFVTSQHIGIPIRVNVSSMGMNNNSCWGLVWVEDKLAPRLAYCLDDITVGCNETFDLNHNDTTTELNASLSTDTGCSAIEENTGAVDSSFPVAVSDATGDYQEFPVKIINPCEQFDIVQDVKLEIDGNLSNLSNYEFELVSPTGSTIAFTGSTSSGVNDVAFLDGTQALDASITGTWTVRVRESAASVGDGVDLFVTGISLTFNCSSFTMSPPLADPDNCDSGTIIIHSDEFDEDFDECGDLTYSAKRTVKYSLVDAEGNVGAQIGSTPAADTCSMMIFYERAANGMITRPPNWTGVPGSNPILECDGIYMNPAGISPTNLTWDTDGDGFPDPSETGVPTLHGNPIFPDPFGLCELQADWEDQILPGDCPNNYKILRRWVVLNWCESSSNPDNPLIFFQTIKVRDITPPLVTGQDRNTIPVNDPYNCTAIYDVPHPNVINECSGFSYTVAYKSRVSAEDCFNTPDAVLDTLTLQTEGITGNDQIGYTIDGLVGGCNWIVYTVTDDCGNVTKFRIEVDVIDETPPTPICDEYTVVPLNAENQAKIFAESFDDGSYDACDRPVSFSVMRYNTSNCDGSAVVWDDYVKFCCADVGQDVMVALRVTDEAGNSNTCMVTVNVQDKNPPQWTYCPPSLSVDCLASTDVASTGGAATASDNCDNLTISHSDSPNVNNCGVGTIRRTWRALDPAGNIVLAKNQVITVSDLSPFNGPVWPRTPVVINGCAAIDTEPSNTGEPNTGSGDACTLIAATHEDQMFDFAEDACFKILRYWTVIDWCQYDGTLPTGDPARPFPGMWKTTQVIKVNNSVKPVFEAGCMTSVVNGETGACSAEVSFSANVSDDCTSDEDLIVTFMIDYDSNGTYDFSGTGTTYQNNQMPLGRHRVKWTAEDRCLNVADECFATLNVEDQKPPTPYCLGGTTTVIMENTGDIEIWASDFDLGSTDNCPGPLTFTMKPKGSSQSPRANWTFDCDNANDVIELEIHVTDSYGNSDFCYTFVRIQANGNVCNTPSFGNISGVIHTEANEMVSDVEVMLEDMTSYAQTMDMTSQSGQYQFSNVTMYNDYEITAHRNDDPLNGVSTLDLVKIQRHIIGLQYLDSAYKVIAADVNNNQGIAGSDLVELRRLILGIQDEFNNSESWRFVEESQAFSTVNAPWPLNEILSLFDFDQNANTENFIAVKVGDVSGNAVANAAAEVEVRTAPSILNLKVEDQSAVAGEIVTVPVYTTEATDLSGLQFTMNWNSDNLTLETIESGQIAISESNYNANMIDRSLLGMSWNAAGSEVSIDITKPMFTVVFRAENTLTSLAGLELSADLVSPEAYTSDLETKALELTIKSNMVADQDGVVLYQNRPNPFSNNTVIDFRLPKSTNVDIKVYNTDGKLVWNTSQYYNAGMNSIEITQDDLPGTGILYYEIAADGQKWAKKMMKVK